MTPKVPPPLSGLAIALAVAALGTGLGLLILDVFGNFTNHRLHGAASALPLILVGLSWLSLQPGVGVNLIQFLKRLIAAVAFVLWGIDQMLPPGRLASTIGDVVIALFVLDMVLIVRGELTADPND